MLVWPSLNQRTHLEYVAHLRALEGSNVTVSWHYFSRAGETLRFTLQTNRTEIWASNPASDLHTTVFRHAFLTVYKFEWKNENIQKWWDSAEWRAGFVAGGVWRACAWRRGCRFLRGLSPSAASSEGPSGSRGGARPSCKSVTWSVCYFAIIILFFTLLFKLTIIENVDAIVKAQA